MRGERRLVVDRDLQIAGQTRPFLAIRLCRFARPAAYYRRRLVGVAEGHDVRSVEGTLTLRRQPPGLDSLGAASTPLFGFTGIDLGEVGAHRVGDPAGRDPRAPGVLVLESEVNAGRHILLRLGADANRRDGFVTHSGYFCAGGED